MKFIQAHQMAKNTMRNGPIVSRCPSTMRVRELQHEGRDGDDEHQVEEQLERRGRAMVLVLIAAAHAHVEAAAALVGP